MNERLLAEVRGCTSLPTLPGVAMHILDLARRPDVDIRDIAATISNDPALSSRILKTVNSSFYGLSKTVATISQALVILGLQSVKTLALGFSLVGTLNSTRPPGFNHMAYWRRSIYSAVAARTLAEQLHLVQAEEAFIAALLQDIGVLALCSALGTRYEEVCAGANDHHDLLRREQEQLGLTHAEVGKALAEDWSLPPLLAVPVGCHHDYTKADKALQPITRAVHLAGLLADVFILANSRAAIDTARRTAHEFHRLPPADVDKMLECVGQRVREVADLFEVNIGQQTDYQSILARANQALLDIGLQSQRLAAELEDRNKRLQAAATTDPLTGVANRARFKEFFEAEFRRARKFLRPVSVLFVDADHFKKVNDTYGHAAGDEVLRALGRLLQEACRGSDLVARYGGEEFTCVLTETGLVPAAQLAEAIRLAISEETITFEGQTIPITVSVGVASMEGGQFFETAEALLECADRAVYAAKRDGRNCVRIYNAAAARKKA